MASRHVVFSHGQESGPWGTKISAMSEVAKSEGWNVDSVDYRGVNDPRDRVTRLLSFCRDLRGDLVLVGSSMGGYVATSASALLHILDSDHRLHSDLSFVNYLFEYFLVSLDLPKRR
jgi:predicted esterase YcpF (UPF0227 family)